jgi:hypothetical protein
MSVSSSSNIAGPSVTVNRGPPLDPQRRGSAGYGSNGAVRSIRDARTPGDGKRQRRATVRAAVPFAVAGRDPRPRGSGTRAVLGRVGVDGVARDRERRGTWSRGEPAQVGCGEAATCSFSWCSGAFTLPTPCCFTRALGAGRSAGPGFHLPLGLPVQPARWLDPAPATAPRWGFRCASATTRRPRALRQPALLASPRFFASPRCFASSRFFASSRCFARPRCRASLALSCRPRRWFADGRVVSAPARRSSVRRRALSRSFVGGRPGWCAGCPPFAERPLRGARMSRVRP